MGVGGLDTALSGLRVAQQQLNVIASNVSNVNTEGYTRKILPQQTVVVGGDSAGARAGVIMRRVDLNLERDFWTQVSTVNGLEIKQKYLERIQEFHGPPDLEVSVAAEIAQLRDAFASLADSPEDNFLQRAVVDQAELIAGKVNKFAALITEMRNDTQEELEGSVEEINNLLQGIAAANAEIKYNTISGRTTAELQDTRDKLVKKLSEEMDISFFTRGDNVMVVQTRSGVQLADEKAQELFYNRTPIGPSSYYPDPINPEANGIFVGGDPEHNPVSIDITQTGLKGKVGALLELRDQILPEQQAMLDELAHKLALRFQEQGLTLFTDAAGQVPADSTANLIGNAAIDPVTLAAGGALSTAGGVPWTAGLNDTFTLQLNPNGTAPQAQTLTINLTTAEGFSPPIPPFGGALSLVNYINDQIANLPDSFGNTVASLDANGQINIVSDYDIRITASGGGQMGNAGLATLGFTPGTEYAAPKTNPLTPVSYVGFSTEFRVSQIVLNDNSLVQQGTVATDIPVQEGSNEVIRRILEFTFGDTKFKEAVGNIDLRAAANGTTLQQWLGIYSQNSVTSTIALSSYADINSLLAAGGDIFVPPAGPVLDQFRITFDDPRTGLPSQTYYLDLEEIQENFPIGGAITNAAHQMAAAINALPLGAVAGDEVPPLLSDPAPPNPAFAVQASVNGNGQLIISSRANITIDIDFSVGQEYVSTGGPDGSMGEDGLAFLGLSDGTAITNDPYIDVQVGNDPPTRITIEPGDDENDLYNKLIKIPGIDFGVPGLAVDDDLIAVPPQGTGTLILRPGDSSGNPTFGGDIKIVGGSFQTDGSGLSAQLVGQTVGIVEALFGTTNPLRSVPHELSTGSGRMEAFRRERLGPNAGVSTGIISSTNLIDYAQKLVNRQAAEMNLVKREISDETAFRDLLSRRLMDESGVNLDEELSNLIIMQTAFAAAARVISAIDEEFQELMNAVL